MASRSLARALRAALASAPPGAPPGRALASAAQPLPEPRDEPAAAPPPPRADTFRAAELIHYPAAPRPLPSFEGIKFGQVFSDHMLTVQHDAAAGGWGCPELRPLAPLPLHPAAQVLHYGTTCFEGLKAYAGPDGRPRLFRPALNAVRLRRSAARLLLADFAPGELLACLAAAVRADARWVPAREGHSLYVRPFMFSPAVGIGLAPPSATTLAALMCPVGPYFPSGVRPVTLLVDERNARAWPGGVGDQKLGGNYAPTLAVAAAATAAGAQQVVYTRRRPAAPKNGAAAADPGDAEFEECGSMNVFFLLQKRGGGRELVTPALDGTILPGITRASILELARAYSGDLEVSERALTLREAAAAAAEGRLLEVFGAGTACVVQPVAALVRAGGAPPLVPARDGTGRGALAARLLRELLDIQYGRVEGHPWSVAADDL
jgi:branched-chain amino acid aminotransferase